MKLSTPRCRQYYRYSFQLTEIESQAQILDNMKHSLRSGSFLSPRFADESLVSSILNSRMIHNLTIPRAGTVPSSTLCRYTDSALEKAHTSVTLHAARQELTALNTTSNTTDNVSISSEPLRMPPLTTVFRVQVNSKSLIHSSSIPGFQTTRLSMVHTQQQYKNLSCSRGFLVRRRVKGDTPHANCDASSL